MTQADLIESIEQRLDDLRQDEDRLLDARAMLVSLTPTPQVQEVQALGPPSEMPARVRRAYAARGERVIQVKRLLQDGPMSVPELADQMQMVPNGLYPLVRRLAKNGELIRDGSYYRLGVSGTPAA